MKKVLTIIILLALGYLGFTWFQSSQVTSDIEIYEIQKVNKEKVSESNETQDPNTVMDGSYIVEKDATTLNWKGRTALKSHYGTVDLSEGDLAITNTNISGSITFNMSSISSEVGGGLDSHLKNEDFFDVEKYPVSTLVINKYESGKIFGDLTIKGITNSVELPVLLGVQADTMYINGEFTIDRTLWGIEYSSGSVFANLGDKAIYDDIELSIDLQAEKNA